MHPSPLTPAFDDGDAKIFRPPRQGRDEEEKIPASESPPATAVKSKEAICRNLPSTVRTFSKTKSVMEKYAKAAAGNAQRGVIISGGRGGGSRSFSSVCLSGPPPPPSFRQEIFVQVSFSLPLHTSHQITIMTQKLWEGVAWQRIIITPLRLLLLTYLPPRFQPPSPSSQCYDCAKIEMLLFSAMRRQHKSYTLIWSKRLLKKMKKKKQHVWENGWCSYVLSC